MNNDQKTKEFYRRLEIIKGKHLSEISDSKMKNALINLESEFLFSFNSNKVSFDFREDTIIDMNIKDEIFELFSEVFD